MNKVVEEPNSEDPPVPGARQLRLSNDCASLFSRAASWDQSLEHTRRNTICWAILKARGVDSNSAPSTHGPPSCPGRTSNSGLVLCPHHDTIAHLAEHAPAPAPTCSPPTSSRPSGRPRSLNPRTGPAPSPDAHRTAPYRPFPCRRHDAAAAAAQGSGAVSDRHPKL